jgi:hypothetical protein
MNVKSGVLNNTSVAQPLHVDLCQFFCIYGRDRKKLTYGIHLQGMVELMVFRKEKSCERKIFC